MDISDLIVDEEFESVIPPLDDEEFKFLKESILQDGEVLLILLPNFKLHLKNVLRVSIG